MAIASTELFFLTLFESIQLKDQVQFGELWHSKNISIKIIFLCFMIHLIHSRMHILIFIHQQYQWHCWKFSSQEQLGSHDATGYQHMTPN